MRERPAGTVNAHLASGRIEIVAEELELLNRSEPLPFQLDESVNEEVRLRYRYLDLRREVMSQRLRLRHRITRSMRGYLDAHGFVDIETPMLTKATPEGARDYLVPSRTHPGKFFALPQSPQIFKQLLMMAGFDRYYQIVRCFRDEDLRADRQPEFTQLDVETSFLAQDEIMPLMEELVRHFFARSAGRRAARPVPAHELCRGHAPLRLRQAGPAHRRSSWSTSRIWCRDCDFKVFAAPGEGPARAASRRCACRAAASMPRTQIDEYTAFVARYGAKGLAYIKVNDAARGRDGLQSPIIKFLSDAALAGILERTQAADNDLIFFGADSAQGRQRCARRAAPEGRAGPEAGRRAAGGRCGWSISRCSSGTRTRNAGSPCIIPSRRRRTTIRRRCAPHPAAALAKAYDLVLNGSEIGGGSVRIHRQEMQSTVFELLGIGAEEAQRKFGFLLDALKFGAPPHGGIAFGLDRLAMLMAGADSIREVIAFPKTQTAADPLTDAPTEVSEAQLRELHMRVRLPQP